MSECYDYDGEFDITTESWTGLSEVDEHWKRPEVRQHGGCDSHDGPCWYFPPPCRGPGPSLEECYNYDGDFDEPTESWTGYMSTDLSRGQVGGCDFHDDTCWYIPPPCRGPGPSLDECYNYDGDFDVPTESWTGYTSTKLSSGVSRSISRTEIVVLCMALSFIYVLWFTFGLF